MISSRNKIGNTPFQLCDTEHVIDDNVSDPTTIIAAEYPILSAHTDVDLPQHSDGAPLTGESANLPVHGEHLQANMAQEGGPHINCIETGASTLLELDASETLSNNAVVLQAIAGADTPPVPAGGIGETDSYTVQLTGDQPPSAPPSDMPTKKKRNRLSKEIREMIVQERQDGHPELRIARDCKVSLAQVERVLYQYVTTHGHSLPPIKYLILKGGAPIKNAELLSISKSDYVRIDESDNGEITLERFQLDQESDSPTAPAQSKRKYTKREQNALDEEILHLIEKGHPGQAIALMCGVSESFVAKAFFKLVREKKLTSCDPTYDIIKGGCPLTSIKALGITKEDYVRIERNEAGKITVTKFDVSTLQDLSID